MPTLTAHIDESYREPDGQVIVVGGFFASAQDAQNISDTWRDLKEKIFGVDPALELKYTISPAHPARGPLDEAGWPQARRVPKMLEAISAMNIVMLTDAVRPLTRDMNFKPMYLEGFEWVLDRLSKDAEPPQGVEGKHMVIIDMPPQLGDNDLANVSHRIKERHEYKASASFDRYLYRYANPPDYGKGLQPLRDVDFHPELLASHAKHSDLLQVADVVVGTTRDFVDWHLNNAVPGGKLQMPGPADRWRETNFQIIAPKLRRSPSGQVRGYGFDIFPRNSNEIPARDAVIARVEHFA